MAMRPLPKRMKAGWLALRMLDANHVLGGWTRRVNMAWIDGPVDAGKPVRLSPVGALGWVACVTRLAPLESCELGPLADDDSRVTHSQGCDPYE